MKQLRFLSLLIRDFGAVQHLEVRFEAYSSQLVSIGGRNLLNPRLGANGVGKSTLHAALAFALYGKTAKRLRAADLQPYGSQANPTVTLYVRVDGVEHFIRRTAVPHALTLDGRSVKQDAVEDLIGFGFDVFLQSVLLAQGMPLFLDHPPREKLALLSDTMRLGRFEAYAQDVGLRVQALARQDNAAAFALEKLSGQRRELAAQLADTAARGKAFDQGKQEAVAQAFAATRQAEARSVVAEAALGPLRDTNDWTLRDYEEADRVYRDAPPASELDPDQPTCPTCGAAIGEELVASLTAHRAHRASLAAEWARTRSEATEANNALQRGLQEAQEATRDLHRCRRALDDAAHRSNPFRDQYNAARDRLWSVKQEEQTLLEQRAALTTEVAHAQPWVQGFKDLRLMVLGEFLQTLSVLTTSYAEALGLPVEARFAIERESKTGSQVTGINLTVDGIGKLEAWSGGEAQRLRLATSLGLSSALLAHAGVRTNLLILDEPSAGLSANGLLDLTQFLSSYAEAEGKLCLMTDQRRTSVDTELILVRDRDGVHWL